MPAPARKPIKKAVPPAARNDDIVDWQERQPIVTVITDENDIFPENPDGSTPTPAPTVEPERPPRIPSPIAVKAREMANRLRTKPAPPKKARPPKPRVSVDRLIGGGWQLLAQLVAPINLPVARVIDMQAPVAGLVLEGTIKNTTIDRILQPLARMGSGGEVAFAMMGPPLIVAALTRNPALRPVLQPVLRQSLMSWIEIAGPHLEAVAEKEAKFQAQYGQQIDQMISYFFSDMVATNPNGTDAAHATTGATSEG